MGDNRIGMDASKVRDEALEEAAMTKPTVTPAPGDVMSEDVLKAISFLRNDAHGCAWIAELIERLARERNCYRNDAMRDRSRLRKADLIRKLTR